ncbi:hypothetical protein [Brachybacterium sp. GCM10030268]
MFALTPSEEDVRPRPTSAMQIVLGLALAILCPVATLLAAYYAPYQSPLGYVAAAVVELPLLIYVLVDGAGWIRATRRSRPVDAVPAACALVASGISLFLVLTLAAAHGIRDSALPRLRLGIPLPPDLPYLIALGLVTVTVLIAVLSLLLLVLNARDRRSAVQEEPDRSADAMDRAVEGEDGTTADEHAEDEGASAAVPTGPRVVTRASDGMLRRLVSPGTGILLLLGALASLSATVLITLSGIDDDRAGQVAWIVPLSAVPAPLWAVIESLWRRDEKLGITLAALYRALTLPFVTVGVVLFPSVLVGLLPPVWRGFASRPLGAIDWAGFVTRDVPLPGWVGMAALMALLFGMLGALALTVFVILPLTAAFLPHIAIGDNALSTKPEDHRRNVRAIRALAALIPLVFVFAVLMTNAEAGSVRWWAAMATVVVMVALAVYIRRTQRVDHARRRSPAWGSAAPDPDSGTDSDSSSGFDSSSDSGSGSGSGFDYTSDSEK